MAQNLTTNIVINAKTGNGFGKVGATLTEMGNIVNGISQQLISFGEDSVKVYRQYEMSMREAEVALSTTYGRGTRQLQTVMSQLDTAATNWAATTIFHTDDVANAISEAAHAGWDLDKIMDGIPAAMRLAQAGSLDLSEALNYIVKSTYAAGVEFEDLNHFTDIWTYSANKSATTIGEVGEAMLRMGSTMRFAANPEELMTLIAVMANSGYVGSEAGTLIRNSMMRLIAPTKKANDALTAMGATAEEIEEIAGNENIAAAYEALVEHGFHGLYDESGNMRSVLDVYSEMAVVLGNMAGGIENITNNEEAMQILGSIFPTRSITGALNLMNAAAESYGGLYEAMMGGEAEGYGAYGAETMMDTLNGGILTFESKVERLKQLVGEELKPLVTNAAEFGGEMIDRIAAMDPEKFSMLVDVLTGVAAAGPGMLALGAGFRLVGLMATPVGAVATAITATIAGAYALYEKSKRDFSGNFGNMELDSQELQSFLSGLDEQFSASREQVDQWKAALDEAAQSYETASATFSSKLSSAMATGSTLTKEDYENLSQMADQMFEATKDIFEARASENTEYWGMLFHYDEDNPYLQELIDATARQVEDSISNVKEAGDELHRALFKAIDNDGNISQEELSDIQSYVQKYNDAVAAAMAADEERRSRAAISAKLHKAQGASLDTVQQYAEEIASKRDELLETEYETFLENYYYSNGLDVSDESMKAAENAWQTRKAEITAPYDAALLRLNGLLHEQSELSVEDKARAQAMFESWIGGQEGLDAAAEAFRITGNEDMAAQLEQFQREKAATDEVIYKQNETLAKGLGPSPGPVSGRDAVNFWATISDYFKGAGSHEYIPLQPPVQVGENTGVTVKVYGDTDPAVKAIQDLNGQTVGVYADLVGTTWGFRTGGGFSGRGGNFADGGRATVASTFGEAGPEWAIPEEHSERTAALLNAARAASGFTWPDLLARFGGLNANPSHQPTTIVYSPVIHVADAGGVDTALRIDKQRLDKWWEERRMRDAMEVYS